MPKLNKHKFWAEAVSDCVDSRWEGFIKGRERWQSIAVPWRKQRLDRLDGDLPKALLRNRRNSCPCHIHCTQKCAGIETETYPRTHSCSVHTHTLELSLPIVAWGHIFAGREAISLTDTGKSHEADALTSQTHISCTAWQVKKTLWISNYLCLSPDTAT